MTLQVTRVNTPSDLYPYKCPYEMTPTSLTIHETGNFATAMSEISYMLSNTNEVSYHFAVDDERAVQGLPLDRNGWHSGDGQGDGNRKSIGIEICYNYRNGQLTNNDTVYNPKYLKARQNAIELAANLHIQFNWGEPRKGVTLFRHYDRDGKNCPQRIIADGYWDTFCNEVIKKYKELKGETAVSNQKPTSYIKGDKVVIAPEAKTPITTPARHFTRGEFMTNWTVEGRNGLTLIIQDNNSTGKLTVKDTDVVYMPTNDIGFMDSVVIIPGVTNWRGGKVMTEGAKNGKYSVRQRDLGRNLYLDDGWGNEGWVMDSQVERIK